VLPVGVLIPEFVISRCTTRILSIAILGYAKYFSRPTGKVSVPRTEPRVFSEAGLTLLPVLPTRTANATTRNLSNRGLPLPSALAAHRVAQMALQHQLLTRGT
jgi:hypothetical protein